MIVSKEKIIQKLRSDGGRAGEGEGERSDRLAASGASRDVQDMLGRAKRSGAWSDHLIIYKLGSSVDILSTILSKC